MQALQCAAHLPIAFFEVLLNHERFSLKIHDDLHARLRRGRPFDVRAITDTIQRALASAGLDIQSGPMKDVTDTIQQSLSAAGLSQALPHRAGTA